MNGDEDDTFSLCLNSVNERGVKPSVCPSLSSSPSPSISTESYSQGKGRRNKHTAQDRTTDITSLPLPLSLPSSVLESDMTVQQILESYPKSLNIDSISDSQNHENSTNTDYDKTGNLEICDYDDSVVSESKWKNEEKKLKEKSEKRNSESFQISISLKKPLGGSTKDKNSLCCVLS